MYEVELKFALQDPDRLVACLGELDAKSRPERHQEDLYFLHPVEDFAETDRALRIRTVGEQNVVTFKGPVVDSRTKTRQELEISLADGKETARRFTEMLQLLGFQPVRAVTKVRRVYCVVWKGREIEVSIDDVTDLGTFVELESLTDEADRKSVGDSLLQLASRLELESPIFDSYLSLLMDQDNRAGSADEA